MREFKAEFENQPRLRIHTDQIEQENIVVYEYFKTDLLALVENYPALPIAARKAILKEIALVLHDMHMKDWIHLGKRHSAYVVGPGWINSDICFTQT